MLEQNMYELMETYNVLMNVKEEDKSRFKNIIAWTKEMLMMNIKEKNMRNISPKRGEVWTCNFGENVGCEIGKPRPCVIIQNDIGNAKSATTIVLPISSKEVQLPTHVGLEEDSLIFIEDELAGSVITEQIRAVSKARLGRKIGSLSEKTMKKIEEALLVSLGFKEIKH